MRSWKFFKEITSKIWFASEITLVTSKAAVRLEREPKQVPPSASLSV
jgi:hypothetical protein